MKNATINLSLLALLACGDQEFEPLENVGPALGFQDALAFPHPSTGTVLLVDPSGTAGPAGDQMLVRIPGGVKFSSLRRIPAAGDRDRKVLAILDPRNEQVRLVHDKSGQATTVDVGVPFDRMDVSPDGRFGVAYQRDADFASSSLFAFPNAVSVLSFGAGEASTETLELGPGGSRPLQVEFAERSEFSVTDGASPAEMSLALVFVDGGLVPLDLDHGVAGPFVPLDIDAATIPATVAFTNNESDTRRGGLDNLERAFVRTSSGELFVLAISAVDLGSTVTPVVALENVVTPDRFIYDMALFFSPDGRELLLATAQSEIVLVDGYTGVAERFAQTVASDRIVAFEDPDDGRQQALAFSSRQPAKEALRLDPLALDARRSTGVQVLRFGERVLNIMHHAGGRRAVVEYENERELGILELGSDGDLVDLRFGQTVGARELNEDSGSLLLVGNDPVTFNPTLVRIDLDDSLRTQDVVLDQGSAAVGAIDGWVWAQHQDALGAVTFFPAEKMARAQAISITGLAAHRVLALSSEDIEGAFQ